MAVSEKTEGKKKSNKPVVTEYKGHKLICLNPADRFPQQFGVAKAKRILDNISAIEKFVEEYGDEDNNNGDE